MNMNILISIILVSFLFGCGEDQSANHPQKTFGGQLGDSYKGMLDEAKHGAESANEQMQRTEQAVRGRDR